MTEVSAVFAAALEAERDSLNRRFVQRQLGGNAIDREAFFDHLRASVAPLVDAVQAVLPERTRSTVVSLYDISLDLFAAQLLGPETRSPWIGRVWKELLPTTVRLLARDPQPVVGCLCNAIHQVTQHAGAKPELWFQRMVSLGPFCQSLNELLSAGAVCAWQAGLVQYRQAALSSVGRLSPSIAARALGLRAEISKVELDQVVQRLTRNRWLKAETTLSPQSNPRIVHVATVGAFSGFGGVFHRPPKVDVRDGDFVVTDGAGQFRLLADAYGAWFRRLDTPHAATKSTANRTTYVDGRGTIHWDALSLLQPQLAKTASQALQHETLAVTIPTSYRVFLYALGGVGE